MIYVHYAESFIGWRQIVTNTSFLPYGKPLVQDHNLTMSNLCVYDDCSLM